MKFKSDWKSQMSETVIVGFCFMAGMVCIVAIVAIVYGRSFYSNVQKDQMTVAVDPYMPTALEKSDGDAAGVEPSRGTVRQHNARISR